MVAPLPALAQTSQKQATQFTGSVAGINFATFDTTVRPQDDFFRFVNGTWLKTTTIPADRSNYGASAEIAERTQEVLRQLIEQAAAKRDAKPGSDEQRVGDYYRSYMDSARIESLGLTPLKAELARIAAVRDKKALPEAFAKLQRLGAQVPWAGLVAQDQKKADEYIAIVSQSGLGMPDRDYYLMSGKKFDDTRAAYATYVETIMRLSGDKDPAGAAKAILALEEAMAKAHWDRAKNRDRELTYNRRTVAQLDAAMPEFSWTRYVKAVGIEKTPAVIVRQPDYFTQLNVLMGETPLETWKRYMTFKLVHNYADELSSPFANARFQFMNRTLAGQQEERPRWKRGVSAVGDAMGEILGRMYVEREFKPEAKARMAELVANLRKAFESGITELEWMSPSTKQQAQAKLAKFGTKIGYPDKWREYPGLVVRSDDLIGNKMRATDVAFQRIVGRLGKPIDRTEWNMTPQTVNAYYSSTMNEIVFPAAILQPPYFNLTADDAVNYGGIGGVIGHEFSHGFDDQGRRSDGEGNLRDWWTEEDAKRFLEKANTLVAQYGALSPVEGLNVNGRLTLGENIGDLSGLAVAYKAYKLSLNGKEAPVINGLTGDQRFFIGWAQVWRRIFREEQIRQQLLSDPHSPAEYRVNQVLKNMPEFYAAWNVKEGDGMYLPPEKRVKIW
ncbi:MAG TPA: M13 family metallopeptidase [Gemmatimonadaceae bacterium]|nr:M13 family metallopeptidase [Gemmatimonadaceae bacterium]